MARPHVDPEGADPSLKGPGNTSLQRKLSSETRVTASDNVSLSPSGRTCGSRGLCLSRLSFLGELQKFTFTDHDV